MIQGYFSQHGEPLVDCTITFPQLDIPSQTLTFMVSTGTPISTLLPQEAARLGLSHHLRNLPQAGVPILKAHLTFQDNDHGPVILESQPLRVMEPLDRRHFVPNSLMGMDIMQDWLLRYSQALGELTFTTNPAA